MTFFGFVEVVATSIGIIAMIFGVAFVIIAAAFEIKDMVSQLWSWRRRHGR